MSNSQADAVSQYVEQMRVSDPEAQQTAALLQGMLVGLTLQDGGPVQQFLKVVDIEQGRDDDGIYYRYFHVVLESGLKIRVSIEPER